MTLLYLILLGVAGFLLLLDTFSDTSGVANRRERFTIKLLPFALFFWVLVEFIRTARQL